MPVADSRIIELPCVVDTRGSLGIVEGGKHIPFEPRRAFWMTEIPKGKGRGAHAHRRLQQFVVALAGSFEATLLDGVEEKKVTLSTPTVGVYLAPLTWIALEHFSPDAVCLVLCSGPYDETDYLRDWDEYLVARGLPK